MSTVYVLGAGASRAESDAIPLVSDFLEKAFELGKFDSPEAQGFIQKAAGNFGLSADDLRRGVIDIEQLFSLIDSDVAWEELACKEGDRSIRWLSSSLKGAALEGLIGGVLFHVVPPIFRKKVSHHERLAQAMAKGDAVISFNYDLIIDRALQKSGKFTPLGYHLGFRHEISSTSETLKPFTCNEVSDVSLLKLHGSLNWLCSADEKDSDIVYLCDGFSVRLDRDAWGPPSYAYKDGARVWLKVFVVPPSSDKGKVWGKHGKTLRPLWEKAGGILRNCDRVVIVGYSLREADYQSRWLFRRFLCEGNKARRICIVNASPQDRCRLREFFSGLGQIEEDFSFENFVTKLA